MKEDYIVVREFTRGVIDGRVVVRRPGARISPALARRLGVTAEPTKPLEARSRPATPPRPRGATAPAKASPDAPAARVATQEGTHETKPARKPAKPRKPPANPSNRSR